MGKSGLIIIILILLVLLSTGCITNTIELTKIDEVITQIGEKDSKIESEIKIEKTVEIDWLKYGPYDGVSKKFIDQEQFDQYKVSEIMGRPVIWVDNDDHTEYLISGSKETAVYDDIRYAEIVNNKFGITAEKNDKFYIIYNMNELGPYDLIEYVDDWTSESSYYYKSNMKTYWADKGKIVYRVLKDNKIFFVVDGKEIGTEYDKVGYPTLIGDKIAFIANSNCETSLSHLWRDEDIKWYGNYYTPNSGFLDPKTEKKLNHYNCKIFINYDGEELGKNYDYVGKPIDIGGKLAFSAAKGCTIKKDGNGIIGYDDCSSLIVYDGEEIRTEGADLSTPHNIGGNLAYVSVFGEYERYVDYPYDYLIHFGGKTYGPYYDLEHDRFDTFYTYLKDIDGKLAYVAKKGEDGESLYYDGKKLGEQYDQVVYLDSLKIINGKLLYEGVDNCRTSGYKRICDDYYLNYDGTDIGPYDGIGTLEGDYNDLSYSYEKDDNIFFVYGDTKLGPYDYIVRARAIGDSKKLVYLPRKDQMTYVVFDGKELGPYEEVPKKYIEDFDDKPLFKFLQGESEFIVYDGQVTGPLKPIDDYYWDKQLEVVLGKVALLINEYNEIPIMKYGGQDYGTQYDVASLPVEVNGKLTYAVRDNGEEFVVYGGEEEEKYDIIGGASVGDTTITDVEGKLAYVARKNCGNDNYDCDDIIIYGGQKIETGYDRIIKLSSYRGKLVAKVGNHCKSDSQCNGYFIIVEK